MSQVKIRKTKGYRDAKSVLDQIITKYEKEYDETCIDNLRIALVDDVDQMNAYKKQLEQGCCGFYDDYYDSPVDGKTYKIGFNYGH